MIQDSRFKMKMETGKSRWQNLLDPCFFPVRLRISSEPLESPRSGFTLLFAVLVGSLLFTLGTAIANLAIKELVFSVAARDSDTAFYAADTGAECALYWDIGKGVFPASEGEELPEGVTCVSASPLPVAFLAANKTAATTTFEIPLAKGCAAVLVGKTTAGKTVIESRGRNDCGAYDNPKRVERALRVRY